MEKPKNLAFGHITNTIDTRFMDTRITGEYEAT